MDADDDDDDLPPLHGTRYPRDVRIGTVVDRWDCPACERTIDVVFRPGRARIYCSQACRQRAYRWRRRNAVHTVTSPGVRSPGAYTSPSSHQSSGLSHAVRTERDPMSRRRDRRGREVTVCGTLARPTQRSRAGRPLGLVPPGAWTPRPDLRDLLDPPDDVFVQITAWRAAQYRPGPAPGCRDPDSPGAPPAHQPGRR